MTESNASLRFDEPIEGSVTAPLSGEKVSRSTSNSPATAVTQSPDDIAGNSNGFHPGMQIGTYRLISKLGEGGMGIVFKAKHTKLDKIVAIKLLPTAFLTQPSTLARFELEMKVVGRLEHPNIVGAFDAGEEKGTHYLVMEFVEGTDLQRLVARRGVLTVENACKAIYQAALGLQAAHEAGVIHRDVKPSNLFVTKDGRIKILDLGLARLSQDDGEGLTKSGQVFGTPEYMAPEQWDDVHGCDGRTDLYALGCTLFFLLTGHPPYGGEEYKTAPRKMLGHINDPIPHLKTRRSDVPRDLESIYVKLMAKNAQDRFPSAKDLADALSPWIEGESKLTQLPLSPAGGREMSSAATVPDQTDIEGTKKSIDRNATEGAVDMQDQFSPTLVHPLSHTGGITQRVVEPPSRLKKLRRAWLVPGGLAVLALAAGLMVWWGRTSSEPRFHPQDEPAPPAVLSVTALPDAFFSQWFPPPSFHTRRPVLSEPFEPVPAEALVDQPSLTMDAGDPVWFIPGGDVAPTTTLRPGETTMARAPAPGFPEPEQINLGPQRLAAPFNVAQIKAALQDWAVERNLPADQVETTNSIGMPLVFIPPGEFDMGSSSQLRRVKISQTFYVGKFEVTQQEFKAITGKNPSRFSRTGPPLFQPKIKGLNTDRFPADSVTWEEAIDFCNQLSVKEGLAPYYSGARRVIDPEGQGYRLLTEAEWEYVCRAGTDTVFSFGQNLSGAQANIKDARTAGGNLARTQQVGRYDPNQFGLHDLHGNVLEWCFDSINVKGNPKYRALRGGSWSSEAKDSGAHDRVALEPAQNQNNTGFRIARTVPAVSKP